MPVGGNIWDGSEKILTSFPESTILPLWSSYSPILKEKVEMSGTKAASSSKGSQKTAVVKAVSRSKVNQKTAVVKAAAPSRGSQKTAVVKAASPSKGSQKTAVVKAASPSKGSQKTAVAKTASPSKGKRKPCTIPRGMKLDGTKKLSEQLGIVPEKYEPKPGKLSKYGEWRKKNPNGLEFTYIDWRAVLK